MHTHKDYINSKIYKYRTSSPVAIMVMVDGLADPYENNTLCMSLYNIIDNGNC